MQTVVSGADSGAAVWLETAESLLFPTGQSEHKASLHSRSCVQVRGRHRGVREGAALVSGSSGTVQ